MSYAPLLATPLDPTTFAPYGWCVAPPEGQVGAGVNEGSAARFDHVAELPNLRGDGAKLNVVYFQCSARLLPFDVVTLERHPLSAQLFVPMNASRYLVVVAEDAGGTPNLATLRAFLARPNQGICYRPNVWHQTLLALDRPTAFVGFVWEDGSPDDCIVHALDDAQRRTLPRALTHIDEERLSSS
jgi:ureidoglycolate lyase